MDVTVWTPHPGPQTDYLSRGEFEVLFGGAAGPGKTECLVMDAGRDTGLKNHKALLLRRTFPQLQEIIDRCFIWYPMLGGTYRSTEHRWYFPSGSTIQLGHMQHELDMYNYQGKEFSFIGFDELTHFTEKQYLYLFSRCRSPDPTISCHVRATSNPGGRGHTWVRARFVNNKEPRKAYIDKKSGLSRTFIPAKIEDNPSLFLNDPGYLQRLESLPEIEKLRLRYGIWDVFEGQVFMELNRSVHGCEKFEIPVEWERFVVFDWGYAKPFCVQWFAVDYNEVLYLYREWYGMKPDEPDVGLRMSNADIARGMREREEDENIGARVADPAIWNKTPLKSGGQGPSVQEDMGNEGVFFLKADNDRLQGKMQFHERLVIDKVKDENGTIIKEEPRLVVFNTCKHWWRTVPEMQECPRNPEDVDSDQEDHCYDCTRYGLMFRRIAPRVKKKVVTGTFSSERKRYLSAKKKALKYGISMHSAYSGMK